MEFIRHGEIDKDSRFYVRIMQARQSVRDWVKNHPGKDEEAHWNTLQKKAQTSFKANLASQKRKRNKDDAAPPGAVPILGGNSGGGLY